MHCTAPNVHDCLVTDSVHDIVSPDLYSKFLYIKCDYINCMINTLFSNGLCYIISYSLETPNFERLSIYWHYEFFIN